MSFDLTFYKRKNAVTTEQDIRDYLSDLANISNEEYENEWLYMNEDTEVYFSFSYDESAYEEEETEHFEGFESVLFSFNINYFRPDFFGREAFSCVTKFLNDLDLFVLNLQVGAESEVPHQPSFEVLYQGWALINSKICKEYFQEFEGVYCPPDKCTIAWQYNFSRRSLQEKLGDNYFVPKLFFYTPLQGGDVMTIASWTEHIPAVIPPADYFLLTREYRKLFKKIKDNGLVSYATVIEKFGPYLDEYEFDSCRIIHPQNAEKVGDIFNSLKFEYNLANFAKRVDMGKMCNSKPENG
jgi:hypothetical protein